VLDRCETRHSGAGMEHTGSLLGSSSHLTPLTLETANALLSPFGSHLRGCFAIFFEGDAAHNRN
jgi:hypothetical protein